MEMEIEPTKTKESEIITLDLGHLLIDDKSSLDEVRWKKNKDAYMQEKSQEGLQLLLNELAKLPKKEYKSTEVVELPEPKMVIPRAKPLPKKKPPTKWEVFAQKKGIQKNKKVRKAWDEATQEWKPTYGAKSKKNEKDWLLEVPESADPTEDQFAKKKQAKKERMAKNEYQRLKNIAQAQKLEAEKLAPSKETLKKTVVQAREATASMGKFDKVLPDEKNIKKKGVKRKFQSETGNLKDDNNRILEVFNRIHSKKPKLDKKQAANFLINETMEQNKGKPKKKKPNLSNMSRHQKYGKLAKNKKKVKKGGVPSSQPLS